MSKTGPFRSQRLNISKGRVGVSNTGHMGAGGLTLRTGVRVSKTGLYGVEGPT